MLITPRRNRSGAKAKGVAAEVSPTEAVEVDAVPEPPEDLCQPMASDIAPILGRLGTIEAVSGPRSRDLGYDAWNSRGVEEMRNVDRLFQFRGQVASPSTTVVIAQ